MLHPKLVKVKRTTRNTIEGPIKTNFYSLLETDLVAFRSIDSSNVIPHAVKETLEKLGNKKSFRINFFFWQNKALAFFWLLKYINSKKMAWENEIEGHSHRSDAYVSFG